MHAPHRADSGTPGWGLLDTPLGRVGVGWHGELVTVVDLDPEPERTSDPAQKDLGSGLARDREADHAADDDPQADLQRGVPVPVRPVPVRPLPVRPVPGWIALQIDAYCRQPDFRFSLATAPAGTAFQRRVWRVIATIPTGRTRTYGQIAHALGTSPRAVGGACRANPYPLLVPCHRVVAANGLGGFAGDTGGRRLAFKRRLLAHEGARAAV